MYDPYFKRYELLVCRFVQSTVRFVFLYEFTYIITLTSYHNVAETEMNNTNCWSSRDPVSTPNHIIYASCAGQSNGDKNDQHRFGGPLFNQHHMCALCRQTNNFVLLHVCAELRPENLNVDVLCGDCTVKALLTTEVHRTPFLPQRHATPVVTCLLGMTLLQEIQNIITTIDADSHVIDKWTWSFEIEKTIKLLKRSAPRLQCRNNLIPGQADVEGPRRSVRIMKARVAEAFQTRTNVAVTATAVRRHAEHMKKRTCLSDKNIGGGRGRGAGAAGGRGASRGRGRGRGRGCGIALAPEHVAVYFPPDQDESVSPKRVPESKHDSDSDGGGSSSSSSSASSPDMGKKKHIPRSSPVPSPPKPPNAKRRKPKTQDVDLMIKVKRDGVCIFYVLGVFISSNIVSLSPSRTLVVLLPLSLCLLSALCVCLVQF